MVSVVLFVLVHHAMDAHDVFILILFLFPISNQHNPYLQEVDF
jgi:hypothetical protein